MAVQSYTVEVQYDAETDDYYIQLSAEMLAATGWQPGDQLLWTQTGDQEWQLSKTSQTSQPPPVM
jgi:hypothetical protein